MARLLIGTSGWNHPACRVGAGFAHNATRFAAVEVTVTFRRSTKPDEELLSRMRARPHRGP